MKKSLHILVVDDEDLNQKLMQVMLSQKGHKISSAFNGEEALDAVKSGKFDLVLLDIQLPMLNGLEVCKRIREWENGTSHIPIVALTAHDETDQLQDCIKAGMDDFLSKPVTMGQLFNVVESVVEKVNKEESPLSLDATLEEDEVPVLDLQLALPNFDNDQKIFAEFLRDFVKSLPKRFDEIQKAFEEGSCDTISRQAHSIKGISAYLGAMRLSAAAKNIENISRAGNLEALAGVFQALKSELNALEYQVEDFNQH